LRCFFLAMRLRRFLTTDPIQQSSCSVSVEQVNGCPMRRLVPEGTTSPPLGLREIK